MKQQEGRSEVPLASNAYFWESLTPVKADGIV